MSEEASRHAAGDAAALGEAVRAAIGRLYRRLRAERPKGQLGEAAFTVLTRLHKDGPQTLTALSVEHGVSLATMSEIVNRLTELHYATRTRDETDRRRVLLSATADGDAVAAAARAERHAWFDRSLASLSSEDQALLKHAAELLQRIADERTLDDSLGASPPPSAGAQTEGAVAPQPSARLPPDPPG